MRVLSDLLVSNVKAYKTLWFQRNCKRKTGNKSSIPSLQNHVFLHIFVHVFYVKWPRKVRNIKQPTRYTFTFHLHFHFNAIKFPLFTINPFCNNFVFVVVLITWKTEKSWRKIINYSWVRKKLKNTVATVPN